jgi:hypothetical protein
MLPRRKLLSMLTGCLGLALLGCRQTAQHGPKDLSQLEDSPPDKLTETRIEGQRNHRGAFGCSKMLKFSCGHHGNAFYTETANATTHPQNSSISRVISYTPRRRPPCTLCLIPRRQFKKNQANLLKSDGCHWHPSCLSDRKKKPSNNHTGNNRRDQSFVPWRPVCTGWEV